jgi:hypothetical protein
MCLFKARTQSAAIPDVLPKYHHRDTIHYSDCALSISAVVGALNASDQKNFERKPSAIACETSSNARLVLDSEKVG